MRNEASRDSSGGLVFHLPPAGTAVPQGSDLNAGIGAVAEIGGDIVLISFGVMPEKMPAGLTNVF